MKNLLLVAVFIIGVAVPSLAQPKFTTKGSLVGSWVKETISQEDHRYPDDASWDITMTFQSDGRFVWKATYKRPSDKDRTDASATGTYSVERSFINYQFDKPSPEALKRLPEFFDFRPKKLRGQQSFVFEDNNLRLEVEKTFIFLKPVKKIRAFVRRSACVRL